MSDSLPPGFLTIERTEPVTQPDSDSPAAYMDSPWQDRKKIDFQTAVFPKRFEIGPPEELTRKLYACSGGLSSWQYKEATKFHEIPDMSWEEARTALNRLVADARGRWGEVKPADIATRYLVPLAEFALTAMDFDFPGRKGDHAAALRKDLPAAICTYLRSPLEDRLRRSEEMDAITVQPIAGFIDTSLCDWPANEALHGMMPMPDGGYARIIQSTPDQVLASLAYARGWLEDSRDRRASAKDVLSRTGRGAT